MYIVKAAKWLRRVFIATNLTVFSITVAYHQSLIAFCQLKARVIRILFRLRLLRFNFFSNA